MTSITSLENDRTNINAEERKGERTKSCLASLHAPIPCHIISHGRRQCSMKVVQALLFPSLFQTANQNKVNARMAFPKHRLTCRSPTVRVRACVRRLSGVWRDGSFIDRPPRSIASSLSTEVNRKRCRRRRRRRVVLLVIRIPHGKPEMPNCHNQISLFKISN